jgi:cytochrome d ubiquinol oxidase subunit II
METLWFFAVALMLAAYVVLDGFDLGVGIVHLFVAQTDRERREVLASIGPIWDGNEVWLIAGGGTLFFAFPRAYAVGFSGFYLPLMMVLWLLILRGVSMEFRSHQESPLWRQFWDGTLGFATTLLALVLGAALGNVLRGLPIDASGYFQLPLFAHDSDPAGVLDGYTLLVGLVALSILTTHGALYLNWKTTGVVQMRSRALAWKMALVSAALLVPATWATYRVRPELFAQLLERPWSSPAVVLVIAGVIKLAHSLRVRHDGWAFFCSCAIIVGLLASTAAGVFPVLLRSTIGPAFTLDIHNSSTSQHGLRVGLVWWCIGMPLALGYFTYLFRSFRGKVSLDQYH